MDELLICFEDGSPLEPDNFPWEKVISYLSFHERIRIGRVSQRLRQASINVISETKVLHIDWMNSKAKIKSSPIYHNRISGERMSAWALERAVIRHCAPNLFRIQFGEGAYYAFMHGRRSLSSSMPMILSRYQLPKLEYLDLGDVEMFHITSKSILTKAPNLHTFIRRPHEKPFKFPTAFVAEKLESITLERVSDDTLKSMIGKLPNLRRLKLEKCHVRAKIFDTFLANLSQLESLDIDFSESIKDESRNTWKYLHEINHLWRLSNLKEFGLRRDIPFFFNPEYLPVDLKRIIASFPNLIRLELSPFKVSKRELIDLLRSFTQMEDIRLDRGEADDSSGDEDCLDAETMQQVAKVGRMKKFKFPNSRMKSTNYATLVRSCPRLIELDFNRIQDLDCDEHIDKVLRPFEGCGARSGGRTVKITFRASPSECSFESAMAHCDLKEEEAKNYVKELRENEGIKLRLYVPHIKRVNSEGQRIPDSDYSDDEE